MRECSQRSQPNSMASQAKSLTEESRMLTVFDPRSAAGRQAKVFLSLSATGVALVCGCAAEPSVQLVSVETRFEQVATIQTKGQALVVDPADVTVDSRGRWVVTDRGDKAIKIFFPGGRSVIVGGPGGGPGEFQALVAGGLLGADSDTVFGYDLITQVISLFDSAGNYVRDIALESSARAPLAFLRSVDDTLLLGSGWIPPDDSPAVHLFDLNGRAVGAFLRLNRLLDGMPPRVRTSMGVIADGRDGLIFTALFGYDTILVHDMHGRVRDTGVLEVPGDLPMLRLPERIRANQGRLRRPDGRWVQENSLAVRNVIALGQGLAAIQFAPVDFSGDHDLLSDGGPVLIVASTGRGVRILARAHAPGAVLGSDRDGNAWVLRWHDDELATLDLIRLRVIATHQP
jgi:hypothetical protein